MPPHDGGEVVELEEGREALGVLLALLQVLDDAELALHEAEGAQGEVHERAVDAVPDPVQVGRGRGEFGAQLLALVGHGRALADQMLAVGLERGEALVEAECVRVQCVDGPYDLGELVVAAGELDRLLARRVRGEPGRAEAEHRERPGQRAGHGHRDADGDEQAQTGQRDADLECGDVVVAQQGEVLGAPVVEGRLGAAHQVDAGGERGVDALRAAWRGRRRTAWARP